MAKLSDIRSTYGKSFSVAIANTYSDIVLSSTSLPKNTMIISSPFDPQAQEDIGMKSLLITDNNGEAVRLTYNISVGNGFKYENNSLYLAIDNNTIKENENHELYVDFSSQSSSSLSIEGNNISINPDQLPKLGKSQFGIAKVDGNTIISDNGTISVNTTKLDYADNSSNLKGIIQQGSSTISVTNGILKVIESNFPKASSSSYGLVKISNNSIISNNGVISLNKNSFKLASNESYGLCKPDLNSISIDQENTLKTNYNALNIASSNSFGFIKSDEITTTINNGVLSLKNYTNLQQTILQLGNSIDELNNRIDNIETTLENIEIVDNNPMIYSFYCDGLASATLMKPKEYNEFPENMLTQKVSANFKVNTNCPFKIILDYYDNESPEVTLYEINYNDLDIYPGVVGLTRTYQSTNNQNVNIRLSWLCKNYRSNNNMEYSKKTKISLFVTCANDNNIKKEVKYSILRFNSLYNDDINYVGENDEILINNNTSGVQQHIFEYGIRMSLNPELENNRFISYNVGNEEENIDPYYLVNENTELYHSYSMIDGTIFTAIPQKSSYSLIYNEEFAKIEKYMVDNPDEPGTFLTKANLNNNSLVITPYEEIGNEEILTNDVSLDIDIYGNIILNYNKDFEETEE